MKITERLENLFAAVAFAEEGEPEMARRIVEENKTRGEMQSTDSCTNCGGAEPAKA
jgi:hypothetical protein